MASDTIIEVEGLTKLYSGGGDKRVRAVDDVGFSIDDGEVVGLLGPNGAGKTTVIKSMLGLIIPTEGHVRIAGHDPFTDPNDVYRKVAAVLEGARNVYWRLTVRENLRFFTGCAGTHPNERTETFDTLLSKFGLEAKAHEEVRKLSRGMKQKVSIACALARETPLVFLDEPTLGLDVGATATLVEELGKLVDNESRTVLICSHDMDVVQELCDRVIIVQNGRIVTDERMMTLLDMFDMEQYRISLTDALTQEQRNALERSLSQYGFEWNRGARIPTFRVSLASGDELYEILDALRAHDAVLESIEKVTLDLETAFLETIRSDDDGTAEGSGAERTTMESVTQT